MQKLIRQFLKYFFIVIAAYHIIVTILSYWMNLWISQTKISILRDWLWICFAILVAIWSENWIEWYLKKRWKVWLCFWILIAFSLWVSYLKWVSVSNMMIWIKYWFYFLVIFLTSTFVWYTWIKKFEIKDFSWMQYLLMWILWIWFIWQILKIIKPDLFMSMWYGKLDDFSYWSNPPKYYLTSYEWTMRWQWLFAGPNNYGYFLVAFLPLILLLWWWTWQELKNFIKNPGKNLNFLLTILWFAAIVLTLSRSAIVWSAVVIAFLARNWIKEHKKISIWILCVLVAWIIWLSFLKPESTLGHFKANFAYIWEIVDHPLWHWLWSSGPAVHHEWTMLPENYFMQIMLDIWSVWFILRCVVIFWILMIFRAIENNFKKWKYSDDDAAAVFLQWKRLLLGWIALLIMWLFLHVFEDSMVNYLFFCMFGILSGYLSKYYDQKDEVKFIDMFKNDKKLKMNN